MIKSKTIELFKSFSSGEIKEFGAFVSSPFFNREKVIVKLFEIIHHQYPYFNGRNFTKEKVFAKIYPGKKYNDGMLRNKLSKLHSLAERYLAIKTFESKPFEYEASLLESLSIKVLEKHFKEQEEVYMKMMQEREIKDSDFYRKLGLIEELKLNLSINTKSSISGLTGESLRAIHNNLKIEFLIALYKNASYLLNERKKMHFQEHDKFLMEKIEEYVIKNMNELKNVVYFWYYYNSYKLASTQNEKYFYELREILSEMYNELDKNDKRNIYVILTNYCYIQRNSGNEKFTKEHFLLLRENIERGDYQTTGGFISHIFYMNAVILGLGAGEKEWVIKFMQDYQKDMDDINRQNTFDFCNSYYFYIEGNYAKALQIASTIETNDLSYKHQLKSLYLKIYFDMNVIESFYSHVDSYKHFIANENNASKELRNTINNYITFAKKLFDLKNSTEDVGFEIKKLKEEVKECSDIINKDWILERIKSLKVKI